MEKLIGIGYGICLLWLLASCKTTGEGERSDKYTRINKGVWQYSPVEIDGNDTEWAQPLFYQSKTQPVNYAFTNDERYLYVVLKTADKRMMAAIVHTGIELELRKGVLSKKNFVLQYPLAKNDIDNSSLPIHASENNSIRNTDIYSLTQSKKSTSLHFRWEATEDGLRVQLGLNERKEMVYETRIPFSLFYKPQLTSTDQNKQLTLKLKIPGVGTGTASVENRRILNNSSRLLLTRIERLDAAPALVLHKKISLAIGAGCCP